MPIEHYNGGTVFTGASVDYFRLCTLKAAVGLEMKNIYLRRRRVWTQVKKEFGIPGNKAAVYAWLEAKVAELATQQQHVVKE